MENNDEILLGVSECLIIFSQDSWFFEDFLDIAKIFYEKAWRALADQDEISFATLSILQMIGQYLKNETFKNNILSNGTFQYDTYLMHLIKLFHHKIKVVRRETYSLVNIIMGLDITEQSIKKRPEGHHCLRKLAIFTCQAILIENEKVE